MRDPGENYRRLAQEPSASAAHEAVRRIDALYLIERQIKDLGDDERTRIRKEEAVPQLASLHEWASKMQYETMGAIISDWRSCDTPKLRDSLKKLKHATKKKTSCIKGRGVWKQVSLEH